MSIVEIVKKFCERKNLKFEFFDADQKPDQEKDDPKAIYLQDLEKTFIWDKKYNYLMTYGEASCLMSNSMSIVEVIDAVKKITSKKEKTECCVCYESCELAPNKCKKCNSSTCQFCRKNGDVIKSADHIIKIADLMGKKGMSDISIANLICGVSHLFPSFCPVCREDQRTEEEKEYFELLIKCDEFLV